MEGDKLSRKHLGSRVRITRQYGCGPHSALGELRQVAHGPEATRLSLNVLGEDLHVEVDADDEVEVLSSDG